MDSSLFINLLGFTASVISFVMWLPQAKTTWGNRNNPEQLAGISQGTQYMVVANASIWALYAFLTESYWAGAPGIVNLPLAVMTLILINRSKKSVVIEAEAIKATA